MKVGIFGHDWALRDNTRGCRRVGFFPVLVNLALSGLDEHIAQMPGGPDSSQASESPAHAWAWVTTVSSVTQTAGYC